MRKAYYNSQIVSIKQLKSSALSLTTLFLGYFDTGGKGKTRKEKGIKNTSTYSCPASTPANNLLMKFYDPTVEMDPPLSYDTKILMDAPMDAPSPAFDVIKQQNQKFPPPLHINSFLPPPPPLDEVLPPTPLAF